MSICNILSEEELDTFVKKSIEMGSIRDHELMQIINEHNLKSNNVGNSVNYNKIRLEEGVYE